MMFTKYDGLESRSLKHLIIYSMKEFFIEIAVSLNKIIKEDFDKAVLEIKRLEGNVGFTGHYIDEGGNKRWLNIFDFDLDHNVIHDLYRQTQEGDLCHKNWNRSIFTLLPNNKFEIEYIWDQELQDQVDGYNNGTNRRYP